MESTELIQPFINLGAVGVSFFLMLKQQMKQNNFFLDKMNDIANSVKQLSLNVGKTVLEKEQTIILFNCILQEHIYKKITYAKQILDNNNLKERRSQIEKNLYNEYIKITQSEAVKLSTFNTPAGDLGHILLNNVDYKLFLGEVYQIIFSEDDKKNKINDLRSLMNGYVSKLIEIIEGNISKNNF